MPLIKSHKILKRDWAKALTVISIFAKIEFWIWWVQLILSQMNFAVKRKLISIVDVGCKISRPLRYVVETTELSFSWHRRFTIPTAFARQERIADFVIKPLFSWHHVYGRLFRTRMSENPNWRFGNPCQKTGRVSQRKIKQVSLHIVVCRTKPSGLFCLRPTEGKFATSTALSTTAPNVHSAKTYACYYFWRWLQNLGDFRRRNGVIPISRTAPEAI